MKSISKIIVAIFAIVCICIFIFSSREVVNENLLITSIELKEKLTKTEQVTIYTGEVYEDVKEYKPSEGNKYLITQVEIPNKEGITQEEQMKFVEDFKLKIGSQTYNRLVEDDFLVDFDMPQIGITGDVISGTLVFEIPNNISDKKVQKGKIINEGLGINNSIVKNGETTVAFDESLFNEQLYIEKDLLEEYNKGEYTKEAPFIEMNPYDIAPLTALMMFETQNPSNIQVIVKGKDEYTDVVYNLEGYNKHHEVPITGLYAGYDNNVEVVITGEDGTKETVTHVIKTDKLPDYIEDDKIVATVAEKEKMQQGLIQLMGEHRILVDMNGEVRWFTTLENGTSDSNELLESGRMLLSLDSYNAYAQIYEIDWLGKIHFAYSDNGSAHHEAEEMDNGNILYLSSLGLKELDKTTGEIVNEIRPKDILNKQLNQEYRGGGTENDWIHTNTIIYDEGDVIFSSRNQHAIIKQDYKTGEKKWILSVSPIDPAYSDYYLKPIGDDFEWFYSQHHPSALPDIDNNPDTQDIVLFDNGVHRALLDEEPVAPEDSYSRIVHYRINEKDMTVEQIWDFGEELGEEYFASVHSGAQYLEETGNYIGAFDSENQGFDNTDEWEEYFSEVNTSKVIEVNKNKEVVFELEMDSNMYRAFKIDNQTLGMGYTNLEDNTEKTFVRQSSVPVEKTFAEAKKEEVIFDITQINRDNEFLSITGWAYVEELKEAKTLRYLKLQSENNTYTFELGEDDRIKVPETQIKGFKIPYIDLRNLENGVYSLSLVLTSEDELSVYETPIDYKLRISDEKIVQIKTEEKEQEKIADIEEGQKLIDEKISKEYKEENYTLKKPYIKVNPYETSPLTALVMFETEKEASITVEIEGKDEATTISHKFEDMKTTHQIPVYGLYADTENTVNLVATYKDGTTEEVSLKMQTEAISGKLANVETKVINNDKMSDKITMMMPAGWLGDTLIGVDANGDLRYYNTVVDYGLIFEILENNKIIMNDGVKVAEPYFFNKVYETNLLGKIYKTYETPSIHHDIRELPNGNLIYLGEHPTRETVEDYIVEIDRKTGEVVNTWDIMEILELDEYIAKEIHVEKHFAGDEQKASRDWFHGNGISYDEKTNSLTISSRHQDLAMNIDYETKEINWILTDPSSTRLSENMKQYILTPIGDNFEYIYGPHATFTNEAGNLVLFDNGNNRIEDSTQNYSRIVEYKINTEDMTVEQVYQYGKEEGSELFSMYMSDIDELEQNHLLATFGGIVRDANGNATDDMMQAAGDGSPITHIKEIVDGEVVFEIKTDTNIYRAEKISLYPEK